MAGGFEDRIPDPVGSPPSFDIAYGDLERGESLGRGGNADVNRATVEHDGDRLTVALKEPRFQGTVSTAVVERFVDEAETWERLDDDPGIVGVVDWGTEPLPWLALEYMDGGSLAGRVGSLDTPEATWVGVRLARAVRYAHRHGVAHLDLKPANVLLRETPGDRWAFPKVSDWGLARLMLDTSTSIEGLSPSYAAPEQFADEEFGQPDDFTDIYQLGAVVYELVTGEPPFAGSAMSVMRDVLETPPVPPTERAPDLPDAFDEVLGRALAKEKADRYESVLDLRRALEAILDDLADEAVGGTAAGSAAAGTAGGAAAGTGDSGGGAGRGTGDEGASTDASSSAEDVASDGPADTGGVGEGAEADAEGGLPRRRLLQGGAVAALAAAGGAAVLGTGGDGGGAKRNELDAAGGGGSSPTGTATPVVDDGVAYGGWFSGTSNFEGTVDRTGRSEVAVRVGAPGNGGAFAFDPPAVRVAPGTVVRWTWTGKGGRHSVRASDGAYRSALKTEGTFSVRFESEGVSRYFCAPHESLGMRGAVVVGDADGTTGEQPRTTVVEETTPTATETETPTRELRQGILLPQSGGLGRIGRLMEQAALLPVRQLEGTDLPLTVTTASRDTETNPSVAEKRAAALADDGFPAITGPATSASAVRVAENVYVPEEVVGCSPSATTPELSSFQDLVWRTVPSDTFQARLLARRAEMSGKTASVLALDNAYGRGLSKAFAARFDGTVQERLAVPRSADYSSYLEKVLSGDPASLLVLGYPEFGITVLKQYYAAYDPERRILVPDGMKDGSVPENVNDDLSNVRGTAPLRQGPGRPAFVERYRSEYGSDPGVFGANSYDATAVCLLANVAAGANDGPAINEAIPAVTSGDGTTVGPENLVEGVRTLLDGGAVVYEGAASRVEFDRNGDLASALYEVFGYDSAGISQIATVRVG